MDTLEVAQDCYTTVEAAELAGVSYRQVDWYVRTGTLAPMIDANGSGTRRAWSADDVSRLRVVEALRSLGASTETIRRVLTQLDPDAERWPSVMYVHPNGTMSTDPWDEPCWRIPLAEQHQLLAA